REITDSGIAAVRRLWAGQAEPYDAMGETLEVKTYPAPYQRNIPLWLVFSSSLQIWTKAGREGFNVLALLNSWEMIEESIAHYRQAREQHGLDPAAGIVTIGLHTFIGEENDEVRRLVEEPLKSYLGSFLLAKNDDKCLNSVQAPMSVEEKQIILASAFEDYFENRSLLGDLEKCRKVVDRLQGIGVNEVACLIDFGVDFERVFGALDRLTELKNIYADSVRPEAVEEAPEGESKTGDFSWYYNR
ncbi:MAG: LLM class flavin-dependent oxidoreductase, partial [Exilibacterium sp.]